MVAWLHGCGAYPGPVASLANNKGDTTRRRTCHDQLLECPQRQRHRGFNTRLAIGPLCRPSYNNETIPIRGGAAGALDGGSLQQLGFSGPGR